MRNRAIRPARSTWAALIGAYFGPPGIFGLHPDRVILGRSVMEGGQVSSGSVIKWWDNHIGGKFGGGADGYAETRVTCLSGSEFPL